MVDYLAITGGIGGAKLGTGTFAILLDGASLASRSTPETISNTLVCDISPDIDTLIYTLSGLANPTLGWGRADETWSFMDTLEAWRRNLVPTRRQGSGAAHRPQRTARPVAHSPR